MNEKMSEVIILAFRDRVLGKGCDFIIAVKGDKAKLEDIDLNSIIRGRMDKKDASGEYIGWCCSDLEEAVTEYLTKEGFEILEDNWIYINYS